MANKSPIRNSEGDYGLTQQEIQQEQSKKSQVWDAFIQDVSTEVTGDCLLDFNLPKSAIVNIIEKKVKPFFYRYYSDALYENYYFIPVKTLNDPKFIETRSIILPSASIDGSGRVYSVIDAGRQNEGIGGFNNVDPDFSVRKGILSHLYGKNNVNAISDDLMYYTITESYFSMVKQVLIPGLRYDFNRLTREFKLTGEIPNRAIIINTYETVSDKALFSDDFVHNYTVACIKYNLGSIIGRFEFNLPGDIKLNVSDIKSEGKEEMDNIKNDILEDEGVDFFSVNN